MIITSVFFIGAPRASELHRSKTRLEATAGARAIATIPIVTRYSFMHALP
jgi:hypothetical protein